MATGTGSWRMGGGMGMINENISNAGTLVVDISDAHTKQLLWRRNGDRPTTAEHELRQP